MIWLEFRTSEQGWIRTRTAQDGVPVKILAIWKIIGYFVLCFTLACGCSLSVSLWTRNTTEIGQWVVIESVDLAIFGILMPLGGNFLFGIKHTRYPPENVIQQHCTMHTRCRIFSSKSTRKRLATSLCLDPLGKLKCSQDPLVVERGSVGKGQRRQGNGRNRRGGNEGEGKCKKGRGGKGRGERKGCCS